MDSALSLTLSDLATRIKTEHRLVGEAMTHAIAAGNLLIDAKAKVPHGQWLSWLEANCCEISERTAQLYMRVAKELPKLDPEKAQRVADLSFRESVKQLAKVTTAAKLSPERFDRALEVAEANSDTTIGNALRRALREEKTEKPKSAAIEKPTALQTAMQAWGKMSAEEKAQFREWAFGDGGEGAHTPEEDGELLRLGQQLEALLALWAETHRSIKERDAAIAQAIEKATGMSEEEGSKKYPNEFSGLFGGQAKPITAEERRYWGIVHAIRRKFKEESDKRDDAIRRKFNLSADYSPQWFWRDALEAIINEVVSITPKTLAGLGVQARAVQYFLWNSYLEAGLKQRDIDNIRSFVAATMTLAGLPGPGVPSDTIDPEVAVFAKSFSIKVAQKIQEYENDWWEKNKRQDEHGRWFAGMSDVYEVLPALASYARREAEKLLPSPGPQPAARRSNGLSAISESLAGPDIEVEESPGASKRDTKPAAAHVPDDDGLDIPDILRRVPNKAGAA
jgi:hypothetical protein